MFNQAHKAVLSQATLLPKVVVLLAIALLLGCKSELKADPSSSIKSIDSSIHTQISGIEGNIAMDLVIIPDGYTADELDKFRAVVDEFKATLFAYEEVFAYHENTWNIHRLDIPSPQSGVDEPKTGELYDTYFDASFECAWADRVICVDQEKVLDEVVKYVPHFDNIIVITNSDRIGGASVGNNILTTSQHASVIDTMIHELGHGFADLDDEYTYGSDTAPTTDSGRANTTLSSDETISPWVHWLGYGSDDEQVAMFEGGRFVEYNVWRPTEDSVMRTLGKPFHAVNLEAWTLATYREAGTYFSISPSTANVNIIEGKDQTYSVEPSMKIGAQHFTWLLNDKVIATGINKLSVSIPNQTGNYTLKLKIEDVTDVIRKDIQAYSSDTIIWNAHAFDQPSFKAAASSNSSTGSLFIRIRYNENSIELVSSMHSDLSFTSKSLEAETYIKEKIEKVKSAHSTLTNEKRHTTYEQGSGTVLLRLPYEQGLKILEYLER